MAGTPLLGKGVSSKCDDWLERENATSATSSGGQRPQRGRYGLPGYICKLGF
jgi:hypothetical protein